MLFRFCLYGFLKNQRYFEPFLMLAFLERGLSFFVIGLLIAARDLTVNLMEIPSGAIADSFGRRRSMMVSFVSYIFSFAVLASAGGLGWLVVGMVLYGLGDTFRTGTHKAMIFEWLRLNDRIDDKTHVYGITRSWSQIGSAVSGLIAAAFVLVSGNYQYVFYFSIIPYVLNLINFAGYPAALDGDHEKATTISETFSRLVTSLRRAGSQPRLRRLMLESVCWEGYFAATKDYLQPLLQSLALVGLASLFADGSEFWSNDARKTALLIGPVYAALFFLSAWASRQANRLVIRSGGAIKATSQLWLATFLLYVVTFALGIANQSGWIVLAFVLLHGLKNVWRPILVGRFDEASESHEGATILSIESQSQRAGTFLMAPLLGWAIDQFRTDTGLSYWPIGLVGAILAGGMWLSSNLRVHRTPSESAP